MLAHDPAPGEPWILNDPYAGGTHLPDLTIVTRTELGYAVTRAHHADVGGVDPGSLPPDSRTLDEEGVVIPPTRLDDEALAALVARMRNPDERRGDLRAQLAAHRLAEGRVAELCARRGRERVADAMDALYDYSERSCAPRSASSRTAASRAPTRSRRPTAQLEIRAAVTVDGDSIDVDFAGTAPQHSGNLNCPLAVTRSACFYVVRCLTAPDLPASGGAFEPGHACARRRAASSTPAAPAAVAAGNTETSSRITDVVFAAFGEAVAVPAQGQGTMNNVVLGSDRFTYYETIGGGQGACPDADGPSGVHVAMSNTLNTPAEALELAYPLRVERYELRRGSGGAGRAPRRRRRRARAARARGVPPLAAHAAQAARASRRTRRRATDSRAEPPERRGAARDRRASTSSPATSSGSRRPAAGAGGAGLEVRDRVEREAVVVVDDRQVRARASSGADRRRRNRPRTRRG